MTTDQVLGIKGLLTKNVKKSPSDVPVDITRLLCRMYKILLPPKPISQFVICHSFLVDTSQSQYSH